MKKILFPLSAIVSFLFPVQAFAQADLWVYCGGLPGCGPGYTEKFSGILIILLGFLPLYAQYIGVLFIMIGGAYILVSAGSPERVTKGKNTITWAVIGIFLARWADVLVGFIAAEAGTVVSAGPAPATFVQAVVLTLQGSIWDLFQIALLGVALFSGMRMVISFGKDEEFTKARDGLLYAAIGAIIINLSQQIATAFWTL